jgi:hypothetical protein
MSTRATIALAVARGLERGFDAAELHGPDLMRAISALTDGLARAGYETVANAIGGDVMRALFEEAP